MSDSEEGGVDSGEVEEVVFDEVVYDVDDEEGEAEEEAVEEEEPEEEEAEVAPAASFDSCASDSELSTASLAARNWVPYGECISLCEVVLELGHKKKGVLRKKTVNVERVFVVGKHHIWILSRSSGKKKGQVLAEFHFFAIKLLKHDDTKQRLTISLRTAAPKETTLDFQYAPGSTIMSAIVESVQQITYGYPDNYVNITSNAMPTPEIPEISEYEKIVANYTAQCAFMRVPVNKFFLYYIKNQLDDESNELDLTSVPIILKEGAERASGIQCVPILSALVYNKIFRCVNMSGSPYPNTLRALAKFVLHNKTLTKLIARNVATSEEGMAHFWDYFRTNDDSALQLLDLSGTKFGEQSIVACGKMLASWQHPLTELVLADCGINGKMLHTLFGALNKNPVMSMSIQHLDLSGNKFELTGTQALDSWFFTLKVYCQVKKLVLRNTGLVFGALKYFHHVTDIEEIDLSGNKIDSVAVDVLSTLLRNSTTLNKIVMDNCSISGESVSMLFSYMLNQKGPMSISLANNGDLIKGFGKDFVDCAGRIVELNIAGARMKEQHFTDLLSQLMAFKSLRKLNLNGAVEKLKSYQNLVNSLSMIVTNGLEELMLSDSIGKAGICSLLNKIPDDCKLQKLDLSDNQLGDEGVAAVCAWLRNSRHMQSINLDNNHTTLNGILDICSVLALNVSLNDICIENDYMHELTQLTGLARKRLIGAMTRMTLSLHERDADTIPFWVSNCESRLTLPAPTQQNDLPPAPSYFSEKAGDQPAPTVDSVEIQPEREPQRQSSRAGRPTHRPIIASRVQSTNASTTSPSGAPPSLAVPPTLATPSLSTSQRKAPSGAPPMLAAPNQATPEPAKPTGAGPARRPGAMVAKRSTPARRAPAMGATPKAQLTRAAPGHGSRNFEPTTQLQHDLEAEEQQNPESPHHEEPDPDMPALQPLPVPRNSPAKPGRPAPTAAKPAAPAKTEEEQPEPESPQSPKTPQSPQGPNSGAPRRMFIGQRQAQRPSPRT